MRARAAPRRCEATRCRGADVVCVSRAALRPRRRGGWERTACRTAAKKELDELCDAVTAALGDAPPQAEGGPNAALRNELLRSFDALANAVAAVPAVVAPVQRALAGWAGAIGSAVTSSLPLMPQPAKHKPLPPLPTQQPAAVASPPPPPPQVSPAPGGGAAVAAAIEAAAAAEVTSEMTPAARSAAAATTPDGGALMSPAWWARPDPKAAAAAAAEATPAAPEEVPVAAEDEAPPSPQPPLPAAAGGCCVIS